MKRAVLFLFFAVGCGNVTAENLVEQDAGPASTGVADNPDSGDRRGEVAPAPGTGGDALGGDRGEAESLPAVPTVDAGPASCSPADGCATCTQAGPTGPGYQTAEQCRQVIACVLAGDAGAYPWQSCHNMATGGGALWGGLACAQQLVKSCTP